MINETLTAVPGVLVGHATDEASATGCTVVLVPAGAVAAVDVRGAAPGTRETDVLKPGALVERIHAVVLSGGSAYGLDTAGGVMRWLEERGIGFRTAAGVVPIVPAAVVYDLRLGRADVRPTAEWGYRAAQAASAAPVAEGCVGVGTGCVVGKVLGFGQATKAGLGSAALSGADGLIVASLVATNAVGNVVDPASGQILAGARNAESTAFVDAEQYVRQAGLATGLVATNTTLAVIATNAPLTREQAIRVAAMSHDGLAQAIRPAHTLHDGDTIFVLAAGPSRRRADVNQIGALAVAALCRAIIRSVALATSLAGLPSARDLPFGPLGRGGKA